MLERNRTVKRAPERFRDAKDKFDVIICCEERCFDQVLEGTALGPQGGPGLPPAGWLTDVWRTNPG